MQERMEQNRSLVSKEPRQNYDPWIHRSERMFCQTCLWFVLKEVDNPSTTSVIGRCRRHAPTMNGYPVVFTYDWCGDHKLNENN